MPNRHTIVDRLLALETPKTWSLIVTVFGDLDGEWLTRKQLGVLLGDLGSAIGPALAFALRPIIGLQGLYASSALLFLFLIALASYWARTAGGKI